MIKLLIVDDEYLVRVGIAETIDWKQYGFEIVGDAQDSDEAYEKFQLFHPDIIISDIRMGNTNGLDLISRIHSQSPQTRLVILSGYEQFDYAKRALENGVSAYLLKPVDNDQLLSTMQKLQNEIMQEQEAAKQNTKGVNLYDFISEILQESNGQKEVFYQLCAQYHIHLPKKEFIVANFTIDGKKRLPQKEQDELHSTVMELTKQYQAENKSEFFSTSIDTCTFSIILPVQNSISVRDIKQFFDCRLHYTITVGVSEIHYDITEVISAFDQAQHALDYKVLAGSDRIIHFRDVPQGNAVQISISNQEIENIIQYIKKVDYKNTMQSVNHFFDSVKAMPCIDIYNLRNVVSEMTALIIRSIFIHENKMTQLFGRIIQPATELQNFETVFEIEQWFLDIINQLFENPNVYLDCSYHPMVQQAIAMIMQDYQKPLTIEYVANELLVSQYHFMHIFKQETGKTFNNYLKDYRISVAIDLIKSGQYKIYEIGPMVGYTDVQYFHRVFKQQTGLTPKKMAESVLLPPPPPHNS